MEPTQEMSVKRTGVRYIPGHSNLWNTVLVAVGCLQSVKPRQMRLTFFFIVNYFFQII